MRKGFEVTRTLRKKISDLAKRVRCPINWRRAPGFQWDTKDVACKTQDASNIIHDIAHYAVATKKDRKTVDFGLGEGPDSVTSNKKVPYEFYEFPRNYPYAKCSEIETVASALGIHWEKQLGLPWDHTARYHSWDMDDLEKAWKKLSRKIKRIGI